MKPEQLLTQKVARYLQTQYPKIIYKFDLSSDQKLSIFQSKRNSTLQGIWSKGSPDLSIFRAAGGYHGLFIELKADGKSPYKLNGELKKDKHLENQDEFHQKLRDEGYYVTFATGFNETKNILDNYLKDKYKKSLTL